MFLLTISAAHAFCGTYVGPIGADLQNAASRVIVGRTGTRTTLTLAGDVTGDTSSFALVLPVPEVLNADDVALADPAIFDTFDAYSAPRIVSYTCDQLHPQGGDTATAADDEADGGGRGESADGVVVESQFEVGAYELVVLSAEGADGLVAWLDANGFALSETAAPIVQDYIDAGQFFLAARVDLEALPVGGFLEPLRLSYDAEAFGLPIRLGTAVSPGLQDMLVFTVATDRIAIANYPEGEIVTDCMLPEAPGELDAWYAAQLSETFSDGAVWATEYAWTATGCDPCSSDPPPGETLLAAGGPDPTMENVVVTRLRLRYAPSQVSQDLALYATTNEQTQVRFIQYSHALESDFEICGEGWAEDPGSCFPVEEDPVGGTPDPAESCGCNSGANAGAVASLLGLAALLRRRRRR